MRKFVACITMTVALMGCSNWNKMTPKPLDNTAIEEEIRKNMLADGITGMKIDVSNGTVTLSGDVKTAADRQKAYDDAAKVNGVKHVVNHVAIKP
jgi:osmotically-inducible protein OsmY